MKCVILALALSSAAFFAFAGSVDSVSQQVLFGASFKEGYLPGDQLCDTGAVNGTWGNVPAGVAVATEDPVRGMYMQCSTLEDGLVFRPASSAISGKRVNFASATVQMPGYERVEEMPVPVHARAALALHAPPAGATNYMGWVRSQQCWTNLVPATGLAVPSAEAWYQVLVKFLKADNGREYVQYWLKRESNSDYVPLCVPPTTGGSGEPVYWIDTGTDSDVSMRGKVGVSGNGGLESLVGTEPRRGLILGIGQWRDFVFSESIYAHNEKAAWQLPESDSRKTVSESDRSYQISVDQSEEPATYKTSRAHGDEYTVEVVELEVVFSGSNDDETIPEKACARIRISETDGVSRFACLAGGKWNVVGEAVDLDAKYTVKIALDREANTVSYWYKNGYGLEGGAYRFLCSGAMLPAASGVVGWVDFEGFGTVHEIRGRDVEK